MILAGAGLVIFGLLKRIDFHLMKDEPPITHTYKNMDYIIFGETAVNLTLDSLRCATERNQMKAFQAHIYHCDPFKSK